MEDQTEEVQPGTTLPHRLVEDVRNESPAMPSSPSPALPADDGMEHLRQQMREIHSLAVSTEEKARKMHLLMTRDYRAFGHEPDVVESRTAGLTRVPTLDNPYNIHAADLEACYCPEPVPLCDEEDMPESEDTSRQALGCQHYSRNVKIQCFDCKLWFSCRHCHDSDLNLPFPHKLNRQMTENMLCMICKTAQPAGEECANCGTETAYYYCPKCKLWDNDSTKRIYHCDDCGICRRGEGLGKDYVHCKRCNVCISISTSSTHPCIERATDCDCPLCLDYLFSSAQPVVSLLCGHYMHASCYKDLMTVTYRCPVCNKSAVNMELQWRKLDDEIRYQPMPEEDFEPLPTPSRPSSAAGDSSTDPADTSASTVSDSATDSETISTLQLPNPHRRMVPRKVWIGCNDCGGRGWTPFHWLGLKCAVCDGYNTTQTTPLGNASTVARVPGTYHTQRQHDFTGVDAIRSFGDGSGEGGAAGLGTEPQVFIDPDQSSESRIDSAHGAAAFLPVNQQEWMPSPSHSAGRSYFLRAEAEESSGNPAAASASYYYATYGPSSLLRPDQLRASLSDIGGVPYDMVMRLGRSLSPMRYYIDGLELRAESQTRAASAEGPAGAHDRATNDESRPPSGERTPREVKRGAESPKGEHGGESFWRPDRRFFGSFSGFDAGDVRRALAADDDDDDDDEGEEDEEEDEDDDESDEESNGSDNDEVLDGEGEDEEDDEAELNLPGHL